jgi:hypothetical protein
MKSFPCLTGVWRETFERLTKAINKASGGPSAFANTNCFVAKTFQCLTLILTDLRSTCRGIRQPFAKAGLGEGGSRRLFRCDALALIQPQISDRTSDKGSRRPVVQAEPIQ